MNLRKLILTKNACYKAGKTIVPKGIMVHSTAANNPYLKRYVGPDDGLLGKNQYNNHWNQDRPDGRQVCPHAFIGRLADGSIATYQTLPWNHRGWHAGGDANNSHLGFEICEDNLTDASYFNAVYKEAIELCVYLCGLYNLTEKDIIGHYEGYQKGIASNHGDPGHWFAKHGKSMDSFRAAVKASLNKTENESSFRLAVGDVVEIKASTTAYYPGEPLIPTWVKGTFHEITQIKSSEKEVFKGGKQCVLLGKKVHKLTGSVSAGIMTWMDIDELDLIFPKAKEPELPIQAGKLYRVQVGAFGNRENAEKLMKELIWAGFNAYVKYE
jgi:N-acetylmuramoyl-L-alanine amidase